MKVPQPLRATVLGARGYVGSALCERLESYGWIVNGFGNGDDHGPAVEGPADGHHVFYCAGLTADYAHRPSATVEAHAGLLSRVLERGKFETLVYLSSTRLYDAQPQERGTSEAGDFTLNPSHPRHLYDLSKLLGEWLCHQDPLKRARVARLASVYRDHRDPDGFLGGLMSQVISAPRGASIPVDSSPHFVRDYVHLDDVLDALIAIATKGRFPVYNIGSGTNVSNGEIADAVHAATGRMLTFSRNTPSPEALAVHIDRCQAELAWQPRSVLQAIDEWGRRVVEKEAL